ncbi:MAG: hypothetical protein ABL956_16115 [Hyphomonadaceae bacterium]
MKKSLVAIVFAASVAGCATNPGNVTAQYVSPLQYQSYSCQQLAAESQRIGTRVSEVTGQQQQKATNDAVATGVGVVLFWPALFFLGGGGDKSGELSRLKGESDAIQQAAIQKNCMAQSASAPAAS